MEGTPKSPYEIFHDGVMTSQRTGPRKPTYSASAEGIWLQVLPIKQTGTRTTLRSSRNWHRELTSATWSVPNLQTSPWCGYATRPRQSCTGARTNMGICISFATIIYECNHASQKQWCACELPFSKKTKVRNMIEVRVMGPSSDLTGN
jgi:hypothetical protein